MTVDPDGGAVWFGFTDAGLLTRTLCEALGAREVARRTIQWVERVDLSADDGALILFHEEDGTSQLDLLSLDLPAREAIIARLQLAGFRHC
jgi:hypothetical protein